jgi:hypothetical protein
MLDGASVLSDSTRCVTSLGTALSILVLCPSDCNVPHRGADGLPLRLTCAWRLGSMCGSIRHVCTLKSLTTSTSWRHPEVMCANIHSVYSLCGSALTFVSFLRSRMLTGSCCVIISNREQCMRIASLKICCAVWRHVCHQVVDGEWFASLKLKSAWGLVHLHDQAHTASQKYQRQQVDPCTTTRKALKRACNAFEWRAGMRNTARFQVRLESVCMALQGASVPVHTTSHGDNEAVLIIPVERTLQAVAELHHLHQCAEP